MICKSILAGILISIGGVVFLSQTGIIGSILFSFALLTICYRGYDLYTGKIGFLTESLNIRKTAVHNLVILFINLLTVVTIGYIIGITMKDLQQSAQEICNRKLELNMLVIFLKSTFCGIIMYLAVKIYKHSNTPLGILVGIPVFILSGFEHSIADSFYFATAHYFSIDVILFISITIIGNSFGSLLISLLEVKTNDY